VYKKDEDITLASGEKRAVTFSFDTEPGQNCTTTYSYVDSKSGNEVAAKEFVPYLLTPAAPDKPRINGPALYGARPGNDFLYKIPVSGKMVVKSAEEEKGKKRQEKIIQALREIGPDLYKNWKKFEKEIKTALKEFDLKPNFIKNIILALSEHDDTADYVLGKKGKKQPDTNLRDTEKIKLGEDIDEYFKREVKPYYPDAWMDRSKDKVGYEINFTQYFYKYEPPRALEEIEADIRAVTEEILELEREEL